MQEKLKKASLQTKNDFRKKCSDIRKGLNKINMDEEILSLKEFKESETVFIYISFKDEVETHNLIKTALKEKRVVVPYCVDNNGHMIACEIESFSDLVPGSFGILEPKNPKEFEGKIDFALVPGLGFSESGYRIGYGKGYYDRFLNGKSIYKVGICHKELFFDEIPHDDFDIKLDKIIRR